jgi:threonine synthase
MDISKASNFERFVHDLLGRDAARTAALFGTAVSKEGGFSLGPEAAVKAADFGFQSGRSTHQDRLATIRLCWERAGVMVDPHTADGLKVALERMEPGVPMIVLETALPAKFGATIREAIGMDPPLPVALRELESMPRRFTTMGADVEAVKRVIQAACAP